MVQRRPKDSQKRAKKTAEWLHTDCWKPAEKLQKDYRKNSIRLPKHCPKIPKYCQRLLKDCPMTFELLSKDCQKTKDYTVRLPKDCRKTAKRLQRDYRKTAKRLQNIFLGKRCFLLIFSFWTRPLESKLRPYKSYLLEYHSTLAFDSTYVCEWEEKWEEKMDTQFLTCIRGDNYWILVFWSRFLDIK